MAPLIRVLLRAAEEHSRKESSFIPPESAEPIQLLRSELMDGTLSLAEDTFSSSAAEDVSSEDDDKEESDVKRCQAPLHFKYRLNRIGSVLSRLKSVPFKRRPRVLSSSSNRSCYYMGLCLPIQLTYLHPPSDWIEQPDPMINTMSFSNMTLNEEPQFVYESQHCIICSKDYSILFVESESSKFHSLVYLVNKAFL